MRTLRLSSLNNIPVCHTAVLTVVIMSKASLVLTYLITEGLYLPTTFGGMLLWRWPRWPSLIWDGLLLGPTLLSWCFWWWWLRRRAKMMSAAAAAWGCMAPCTVWTCRCWGDVCLLTGGALYHWGIDSNKPTKSLLLGMAILGATYVWQMTFEPWMWQKTEKRFLENFIKLKNLVFFFFFFWLCFVGS